MSGLIIIQNDTSGTKNVVLRGSRGITGTASFRNSRIAIVKMGASDEFAENLAGASLTDTTANKTLTTVATLTFTPPSVGDYLYVASFIPEIVNATNVHFGFELTDGTNTTGELLVRPEGGVQDPVVVLLEAPSLSASSKSVELKIRQAGTGVTQVGAFEIRLLAIRLDRFANYEISTLGSVSSSTTTTYVDALSQTFTPNAAKHLSLAAWLGRHESNAILVDTAFNDDGTEEAENNYFRSLVTAGVGVSSFAVNMKDYANTSRTQSIRRKASTGASTVRNSAVIACIELTAAP